METTLDTIRELSFYQSKDGYRFSMDPVMLCNFVSLKSAQRIVDIGAGSGVLGMMMASKYPDATVTLIEIQGWMHELSVRNIELNGMAGRVSALLEDFTELGHEHNGAYDVVVSNPPYRKPLTGFMSECEERLLARHEITMNLRGLVSAAARATKSRGRFYMVYHPGRLAELIVELSAVKLQPKRLRFIHGRQGTEARIVLVEAIKDGRIGLKIDPPLVVYRDGGGYTDEVRAIYEYEAAT